MTTASRAARDGFVAGPRLVGVATLVLGLLIAGIAATRGLGEAGLSTLARTTAHTSVLLFLAAFLASPLRRVHRGPATAWLLRQRRYLGLSFAVSHTYHLLLIAALNRTRGEVPDLTTLIGGGIAYAFIAAMAATSTDAAVARLGPQRWRRLHRTGLYYIWLIFAFTYAGSAATHPTAAFFTALLVSALLFRLWQLRTHHPVRDGAVG